MHFGGANQVLFQAWRTLHLSTLSHLHPVIVYSFWIGCLAQLFYWGYWFWRLQQHRDAPRLEPTLAVSVVICAKNEADNLRRFLPRILEQDYPHYEVLVVDDGSTDDTVQVLTELGTQYPHLRSTHLSGELQLAAKGKKKALAHGIAHAQYDTLLLTDADCYPTSRDWVTHMVAPLEHTHNDLVLGYAPLTPQRGLLNALSRLETTYTAIQYLSFALRRMPYMGVGRNLAYRKSLYTRQGGFEAHQHIASGDDDLFVRAAAHPDRLAVVLHPAAHMYSATAQNWRSFFRQKSRHLSTAPHYRPVHQVMLAIFALSVFAVQVYFPILLITDSHLFIYLTAYLTRNVLWLVVTRRLFVRLQVADLWPWLIGLEWLLAVYYLVLAPTLLFRNNRQWK